MSKSKMKSMFICILTVKGIVDTEYVTQGQTVNQIYYGENLERIRNRCSHVQSSIANIWMLLPDNAPYNIKISAIKLLTKKDIPVVQQPT